MISLFQIASNDQSVAYLGQIFGVMSPGVLAPESAPMLLGALFKVFNTSALTLGACIVIYTTIVGLLKTAQEGEFLGKQWSSLWVPLRTVSGIAALFPLPSGYCAIQVIFMWVILQGVGAADSLWNAALNYTAVAGSPTATQKATLESVSSNDLNSIFAGIFKSLVCQAELKQSGEDYEFKSQNKSVLYFCKYNPTESFCTESAIRLTLCEMDSTVSPCSKVPDAQYDTYEFGGSSGKNICGSLNYCSEYALCTKSASNVNAPASSACQTCKAQKAALNQIIPLLGSLAAKVAEADDAALLQVYQHEDNFSPARPRVDNYTAPDWIVNYCTAQPNSTNTDGSCVTSANVLDLDSQPLIQANASTNFVSDAYWTHYLAPNYLNNLPGSTKNFIAASKALYVAAIKQAVIRNYTETGTATDNYRVAARQQGWISAGSYFYQIIRRTGWDIQASSPTLHHNVENPTGQNALYRSNFSATTALIEKMEDDVESGTSGGKSVSSAGGADLPGPLKALNPVIDNAAPSELYRRFHIALDQEQNPLLNIATFGIQLMTDAVSLFYIMLSVVFGIGFASGVALLWAGSGMTLNPIGEGLKAISGMLTPFFFLFIGAMYTLGALLAVYVPLIPFMIFAMGAIGWILTTVEAMVAAPIAALGMLSPGGQSEVFGRAEPAIMLLLNLFLRPGLMVLGLLASTLVSVPVIKFINLTFSAALITGNNSLFIAIILFYIYTAFIITVFSKCYSLIYVIPERVLTWIGGPAVQYGEAEALQATKQAVEAGAGAISGALKETSAPVGSMGQGLGYGVAKKLEERKAKIGSKTDDEGGVK